MWKHRTTAPFAVEITIVSWRSIETCWAVNLSKPTTASGMQQSVFGEKWKICCPNHWLFFIPAAILTIIFELLRCQPVFKEWRANHYQFCGHVINVYASCGSGCSTRSWHWIALPSRRQMMHALMPTWNGFDQFNLPYSGMMFLSKFGVKIFQVNFQIGCSVRAFTQHARLMTAV